jgi:hypothetical protein
MLDVNKLNEMFEHYFATVTKEKFLADLEEFCPEFFNAELDIPESNEFQNTEIYQQAKNDNKLEIAPKLLKKGLSIQEVADILELDVHLLAK